MRYSVGKLCSHCIVSSNLQGNGDIVAVSSSCRAFLPPTIFAATTVCRHSPFLNDCVLHICPALVLILATMFCTQCQRQCDGYLRNGLSKIHRIADMALG